MHEGDSVCFVTGLLYDSTTSLTTFLTHGSYRLLVDRLLEIRDVGSSLHLEEGLSLYMAIAGVGRYILGANAVLRVQTDKVAARRSPIAWSGRTEASASRRSRRLW
jgi:hypothetical protein